MFMKCLCAKHAYSPPEAYILTETENYPPSFPSFLFPFHPSIRLIVRQTFLSTYGTYCQTVTNTTRSTDHRVRGKEVLRVGEAVGGYYFTQQSGSQRLERREEVNHTTVLKTVF